MSTTPHGHRPLNAVGRPSRTHVQPVCSCGWKGHLAPMHSSVEGWDLAERDAKAHARVRTA